MLVELSISEILFLEEYRRKKAVEGDRKSSNNISARNRKAEQKKADALYLSKFLGDKFLTYIKL